MNHDFGSSRPRGVKNTFMVMTSVIFSGGVKMRDEYEMPREVYTSCHDFCIPSGDVKMRDEHGMLREVHTSCHDFCHTFRWYENEGRAWNA